MATADGGSRPLARSSDHSKALDRFLSGIERRAFRIAQISLRDDDDALDAVQDSMLKLVRSYGARPEAEWKPLFYRILENRVRDVQRRRTVRGRVIAWLRPAVKDEADEDSNDAIENAPSDALGPSERVQLDSAMEALGDALRQLPNRQRQAFLLRNFEGMDVSETAIAMGCSEGSVKTHYFRAIHVLRVKLEGLAS